MTSAAFAIPGDITLATGGYAYDRRVLALLPTFGVDVHHLALPGGFPNPTVRRSRRHAAAACEVVPKPPSSWPTARLRRDASRGNLVAA